MGGSAHPSRDRKRCLGDQDLSEVFPDFNLADISSLFKGSQDSGDVCVSIKYSYIYLSFCFSVYRLLVMKFLWFQAQPEEETQEEVKIDSHSLADKDYDDLLRDHFNTSGDADELTRMMTSLSDIKYLLNLRKFRNENVISSSVSITRFVSALCKSTF